MVTPAQLSNLVEALLDKPAGSRVINGSSLALYARAVKAFTGEVMNVKPIPGFLGRYLVILPNRE